MGYFLKYDELEDNCPDCNEPLNCGTCYSDECFNNYTEEEEEE